MAVNDDVLKAMFYAGMMRRKAIPAILGKHPQMFRPRPAYSRPVLTSQL